MHPCDQATDVDCVGFLIVSPRTVPNVSAYRPDYLFHTVILGERLKANLLCALHHRYL